MSLDVQKVAERMRFTLGGVRELPAVLNPIEVCNGIGNFLVSLRQWKWLTRQTATLSMKKNVPFMELPSHFDDAEQRGKGQPDVDIRALIAIEAEDSLVNSFNLVTQEELLRIRTENTIQNGPNFFGAIHYIPDENENLLISTEDFVIGSGWFTNGASGLTSPNSSADPFTGKRTMAAISDTDGSGSFNIAQLVPRHLLINADYEMSIIVGKGDSNLTVIQFSGFDNLGDSTFTGCTIDWSAEPYVVTMTGAGSLLPNSVHGLEVDNLVDGLIRITMTITHFETSRAIRPGISVVIIPTSSTAQGFVRAGRVQVTKIKTFIGASGPPDGPAPYVPNYGSIRRQGGTPRPVLGIWPIPEADAIDKFRFDFSGGWPAVHLSTDILSIPRWMEDWYLEAAQCWARGIAEEDSALLSQRLQEDLVGGYDRYGRPGNLLLRGAMEHDIELQPNLGRLRGGAVNSGRVMQDWGSNAVVEGPT